ncbi:YDG domain-containing protein [Noviherbaspirillum pedocola]|uniref:Filamentous hemagglutinin N-terminal domain-containing protein n=1 Tax=Noviherbaspirillum pedocola TaxID=2801341 RepID=A0A934SWI3_9BURK|nr:YDG domain-containing protein [Noviherbaspirillum pedocola]MBK4738106.1 filamentous hemagglutinin N-terminal domain-containing protein [Noviherbaspirillum pedocola]
MNRIYCVVWNAAKGTWQAASEFGGRRVKALSCRAARRKNMAALSLMLAGSGALAAGALPTGGNVVAGQANIAQAGSGMTITQSSSRAAIEWQGFSIGQGNTVNFVQPSRDAVTLNRVLGPDASTIQGALQANGQVFLVNPNGILFSPSAQVNVGGLVASTLQISNEDFLAGRYQFSGNSSNAVVNQGNLQAASGGNIALIAAKVSNTGTIAADAGNALLGAGSQVLLDFGGPVKLQVQAGALDALIENGGAIRADGGTVYLSAKAAGELAGTVINNTGIVQARTLATGEQGQIVLLGDMERGSIHVGGTLDASAPRGGNGGAIETSAATVNIDPAAVVTTLAPNGVTGQWLIDPYNVTIAASGGNITGAALATQLNTTNVTIDTSSNAYSSVSGVGDITVSDAIAKTGAVDTTLTLRADHNIVVNSPISSTNSRLGITLLAGMASAATSGGVNVNANLTSNGGDIVIGGGGTSNAPSSYANANGIGYALNLSNTSAAVIIGTSRTISSDSATLGGGNITINGKSTATASGGLYVANTAGVYIMTGGTINVGSGRLYLNGESDGSDHVFGLAFQGGSNNDPISSIIASSRSSLLISGTNYSGNVDNATTQQGAIGLSSNGGASTIRFRAPSVADWLIKLNGAAQNITYSTSALNTNSLYGGTMTVPAANGSYNKAVFETNDAAWHVSYVLATGGSKTYDGTTAATNLSYTTTGNDASFTLGSLTAGSYNFLTPSKNAGTYSPLLADPANGVAYTSGGVRYALGYFSTGNYTITPKTLTPIAADKVYDGNTNAAVTASGILGGDNVTLSGTGSFASKNVGQYSVSISGISLAGADKNNYTLSGTSASATANITARTVTVSASKTYDGSTSMAGAVTLGNLVAGEDLTYTGAVANSANVGGAQYVSGITLADGATGAASNYKLPSLTAASSGNTASITPKALTVTGMTAQDKIYDGSANATLSGGTLSGLVNGETLSIAGESGSFADKNVGTGKAVTVTGVTLANGTGSASNYTVTNPTDVTASITPKALTVTGMNAQTKTYDGTTAATLSGGALSGLVNGETLGFSGQTGSFADANAGTGKAVTVTGVTLANGSGLASNYTVANPTNVTGSITPKALTVTGMTAQDKVYDGSTAATLSGGTLSGLVNGETLSFSGQTGSFANRNAGANKAVTVTGVTLGNGTGLASNYTIANPTDVTGSITPKALTISGITAADKIYDGTTTATLGSAGLLMSGLLGSDQVGVSATGAFANSNAGNGKTVNINGVLTGADAANYALTGQSTTTASITPKALTVTGMTAQNRTYDGTSAASLSGGTLVGLVNGETLGFSGQTGSFADKNAGANKAVTVTGIALGNGTGLASNYTVANPTGLSATIAPKSLTVSGITAADKTYDGTTGATVSTAGAQLAGLVAGDAVNVTASGSFADRNAGNGKTVSLSSAYSGTDVGNYSITSQASTTASILAKALAVSGTVAADKSFDGTTTATLVTAGKLDGALAGDDIALDAAHAQASFAQAAPASGIAVNVTGLALQGANAGNYRIDGNAVTSASILAAAPTPVAPTPAIPAPAIPLQVVASATPAQLPIAAAANASQLVAPVRPTPAPSVGALNYLAVPDTPAAANAAPAAASVPAANAASTVNTVNGVNSGAEGPTSPAQNSDAPAVASNRQSATQGLSAGRDVKFLNVFVVSGGIRMPATTAPAATSAATESISN